MSLAQLSKLLPLPDEELKQVLEYGSTLSKAEAAEHFTNLLGDSPDVIEFVSSFNSRRVDPKAPSKPAAPIQSRNASASNSGADDNGGVPKPAQRKKKTKANIHTLAPRQVDTLAPTPGTAYNKKNLQDDYISGRSGASTPANRPSSPARNPPAKSATPPPAKPTPSSAGTLVSELGLPKQNNKPKSNPVSRTSTPGPGAGNNKNKNNTSTKVTITGGVPMQGASTALADLDSAIRSLELLTNPTKSSSSSSSAADRRCNCVGARHPLLAAAPNCLSCGKVICVKEGLGPCTFCGTPLLSPAEVQDMIAELRAERGQERMAADRELHRRAEVSTTPRAFTKPRDGPPGEMNANLSLAEAKAREHRDRLLGFQAQNAKRTTVRDEAADFDVVAGGNIWSTPEERARQLKKQQKLLREMEWNAKPEYEKRRQVVSIDLVKGKVVKKMAAVERPPTPDEEEDAAEGGAVLGDTDGNRGSGGAGGGAFSKNPLLAGMIKPVYDVKGKGVELEGRKPKNARWRRVQDDLDDNEAVVLDGGVYGQNPTASGAGGGDEPNCG